MTKSKRISSLLGWYLVLPSAGPAEITYYVAAETPKELSITYGTDFHQREGEELRDRKQLLNVVYDEGCITKGPGHPYYFITPTAGGWDLAPVYED